MIEDIKRADGTWDNFIAFAGLENIYITSVKTEKNSDAVGKNLIELGKMRGRDAYNAAFDLLLEEENAGGMVDFYGLEELIGLFMQRPEMNVCTDGLLSGGKPHPRVYGTFPRVLGKFVREDGVLSLEDAVYKMTGKPAATFGLKDRGLLKPGYFADIVLFDPATVRDRATFLEPVLLSAGIIYVFVNGQLAVENGKHTGSLNGRVLRGGR
jgi:N-acyl-D-amino-acid deacylase